MCRHEPLNVCHLSVNACLINALLSFVVFWLLNKIHKLFSTFNVCFGRHKMTVFGKWHAKSATSNRPWVVKVWALVRPAFCLRWGLGSSRGRDSQVPLNCSGGYLNTSFEFGELWSRCVRNYGDLIMLGLSNVAKMLRNCI